MIPLRIRKTRPKPTLGAEIYSTYPRDIESLIVWV